MMQSTLLRSLIFPWLLALLLVILAPTPVTHAATVNLDVDRFDDPAVTTAGMGAAACSPTGTSDCSLRGAILTANAASSSDYIINLPSGTYSLTLAGPSEDLDRTGDLDIRRDVTILGAGAATTIVDGNSVDRVLDIRAGNVTLSGVTIKGGKAPDGTTDITMGIGGPGENGGGIRNSTALTLTNSIVTANYAGAGGAGGLMLGIFPTPGGAGGAGGGIYSTGALTVISTTISSNSAGNGGTGASASGATVAMAGALGGSGGDGGGIYNSGTLTITGTILQSNNAGSGGNGGSGSASFSPPSSGTSGGSGGNGGNGGGIYNGGNLSFARVALTGNVTGNGGQGGAGGAGGSAVPPSPGYAGGVGGPGGSGGNGSAIFNSGISTVTNSTLSGNTAGTGGAGANGGTGGTGAASPMPAAGGTGGNGGTGGAGGSGSIYNGIFATAWVTMTSSTIAANNSGNGGSPGSGGLGGVGTPVGSNGSAGTNGIVGTGGGVAPYTGTVSFKNTILANNTTPAGGQGPDCYGTLTSQGYNLIRTLTDCTMGGITTGNITGQDPKLKALADNGGGTLTHGLQSTSPARDAGDPAGCQDASGAPLSVDQRGLPRTAGASCDIGAFELQGSDMFLPLLRR